MKLKRLDDLLVRGKKVFCRVDFNVPIKDGKVTDDLRIESALPTIKYLLKEGATVILASHLGRPDGKPVEKYSLEPVAVVLSKLLDMEIVFIHDCVGDDVKARVDKLAPGQVALLENLRYHAEEEANDPEFARQLASLADAYVDDAFAVAHRSHASVVGIPKLLPHAAGRLIEAEVDTLTGLLTKPNHPFVAIIGGAKISDKIAFMQNLMKKADTIIIGGAMANTFLAAQGHDMGSSIQEQKSHKLALDILDSAKHHGVEIVMPVDVVVADALDSKTSRIVTVGQLEDKDIALDLGPATSTLINEALHGAETVFWNGTLGYTEEPAFAIASHALAQTLIHSKANTVIGGGDTAGYVDGAGMHDDFGFISTGGGAALELLAGKKLPAVEALRD
ncbi:MAG: phosphoglycerate kinase [bacterium]